VLEPRHRHEALALLVEARRIGLVARMPLIEPSVLYDQP
jgi:hypothetical protein